MEKVGLKLGNKKITVVLVNQGQLPQTTTIDTHLSYMESLVDGPVSVERFFVSGYRLVSSIDEGFGYEDQTLPDGTYFIARYHTDFEDMSIEEAEEIKKIIRDRAKKRKKNRGILSIFKR